MHSKVGEIIFSSYLTVSGLKSLSANKKLLEEIRLCCKPTKSKRQVWPRNSTGASNLQLQTRQATFASLLHLETLNSEKTYMKKRLVSNFKEATWYFYLKNYINKSKTSSPLYSFTFCGLTMLTLSQKLLIFIIGTGLRARHLLWQLDFH